MRNKLSELDTLGRFSAIFLTSETTSVMSCLLSYTICLFGKEAYSNRKEFAPKGSKYFPIRVDLFSEGK